MRQNSTTSAIDWAKRVNRSWIVRGKLNEHADAWLDYLADQNDGRLERSCENARTMCGARDRLNDPKPWFYAGLFSLATAAEARRFLATHRVTKATVPAMVDDEDVNLWIDRVGPETLELLDKLRQEIARLGQDPARPKSAG